MSERETRDFMSVDSFSQLPFIRSAPAKPDKVCGPLRLFGMDFPHGTTLPEVDIDSSSSSSSKDNNSCTNKSTTAAKDNTAGNNSTESNRKFECHYCCRNFPTSQALGGHQNAHKRERQHAKRAHLQSTLAAAHHHQALADSAHVYGLVNYPRLGTMPSSARFGLGQTYDSLPAYPSWNTDGTANFVSPRYYAGPGLVSQPISTTTLPGLWRIPPTPSIGMTTMQREPSNVLPLFGVERPGVNAASSNSLSSAHENLAVYEAAAKEGANNHHLSLDLHL